MLRGAAKGILSVRRLEMQAVASSTATGPISCWVSMPRLRQQVAAVPSGFNSSTGVTSIFTFDALIKAFGAFLTDTLAGRHG